MTRTLQYSLVASLLITAGHCSGQPAPELMPPPAHFDSQGERLPEFASARLGSIPQRATADLIALSPDGGAVLTSNHGRTLERWDIETGHIISQTVLPIEETKSPSGSFSLGRGLFPPDGRLLGVWENNKFGVWDTATAKRLRLIPVAAHIAAFDANGRTVAISEEKDKKHLIHLWNVQTGEDRILAELPSYLHDMVFDATGKKLFAAVDNHSLRCWDLATGKQLWQNDANISRIILSSDGAMLFADNYDLRGELPPRIWNAATGASMANPDWEGTIRFVFSRDGTAMAQSTKGEGIVLHDALNRTFFGGNFSAREGRPEILIRDAKTRAIRTRLDNAQGPMDFSKDGQSLFTLHGTLQRWDLKTGKCAYPIREEAGHIGRVAGLAFAPDGKTLLSCGEDRSIRLWNVADGSNKILPQKFTIAHHHQAGDHETYIWDAAPFQLTPDGKNIVMEVEPGVIAISDVLTGKEVRRFELPIAPGGQNRRNDVLAASLSQDGKTLIAQSTAPSALFSGSMTFGAETPVVEWDVNTGKTLSSRPVFTPSMCDAIFAPNGRYLAMSERGGVSPKKKQTEWYGMLDLADEQAVQLVPGWKAGRGAPFRFSPDSRLFASTDASRYFGFVKKISIYEVISGALIKEVDAPLDLCWALDFSPDGSMIAATGLDALWIWETATGRLLQKISAQGPLTNWSPEGFATTLTFSPDGKTLATGHFDGAILLWDLTKAIHAKQPTVVPDDITKEWEALASTDAGKANVAFGRLRASPTQTVAMLHKTLPYEKVSPQWVASRIEELSDDSFATREKASRELQEQVELIADELRANLRKSAPLETQRRLERILSPFDQTRSEPPTTEVLRRIRALRLLTQIGSADALALLGELAVGPSSARQTAEARIALKGE